MLFRSLALPLDVDDFWNGSWIRRKHGGERWRRRARKSSSFHSHGRVGRSNRIDRKSFTTSSGQRLVDEALDEGCLDSKSEGHSHHLSDFPSISLSTLPPSLSAEQCHNVTIESQHRRRRRRGACGRRERILHLYQRDDDTTLYWRRGRGSFQRNTTM